MDVFRRPALLLLGIALLATALQGVQGQTDNDGPSESQCRPYIEKALKEIEIKPEATVVTTDDSELPVGDESDKSESPNASNNDEQIEEQPSSTEEQQNSEEGGTSDPQSDDPEEQPEEETVAVSVEEQAKQPDSSEQQKDYTETAEQEQQQTESVEQEGEETEDEAAQQYEPVVAEEDQGSVEQQASVEEEATTKEESTEDGEQEQQSEEQPQPTETVEQLESEEQQQADEAQQGSEEQEQVQTESGEQQNETEPESEPEAEPEPQVKPEAHEEKSEESESEEEAAEEPQTASLEEIEEAPPVTAQEESAEIAPETETDTEEAVAPKEESQEDNVEAQKSVETEEVKSSEETAEKEVDSKESEEVQADEPAAESADEEQNDIEEEHNRKKRDLSEMAGSTEEKSSEETREAVGEEIKPAEASEESVEKDNKAEVSEESTEEQKKENSNEIGEAVAVEEEKSLEETAPVAGESAESQKHTEQVDEASKETEETENQEEKSLEEKPQGEVEKSEQGSETEPEPMAEESVESLPEEELTKEFDIPEDLRLRDHVNELLKLDEESAAKEQLITKAADITLKELKRLYENAIKPLEILYKYRDLSNRHFGDSEIFSKPLVLFMGPWSGGKSSIINYLTDNEYTLDSLRTGAEPSPAYFNLVMWGEEPEVLDGTQLAADFTFSGLQKFGQGLEERLRGQKLPNKLLEKVNIVEIPGILEVRKQVSRVFPFNDACQWFIDRADIIFLVYDPSKLDVGPETEAILDQLKGREHQTRIILNKADQVKPEELMRVQGALIWNISPLMSSAQPPVMYTTSLWSRPFESWAPVRLLQAQERAFLRDLRSAVDKRIENKIASARRFAVRVRNHAKMVDCYLTTYYNHKSVFGNRKVVADSIIEHPQDYHIYEGLSTLTNISRYDLPDPDVYRDFFRLNPLYDFQQLAATCTYFRGCPINRLDVAIAYDLPELVGKHRKLVEAALAEATPTS